MGPDGFEDMSKSLALDKTEFQNPRSVIAADVDADGAADLVVTQLAGAPLWLKNDGGTRTFAQVRAQGRRRQQNGDGHRDRSLRRRPLAKMGNGGSLRLHEPGPARTSRRSRQCGSRGHRSPVVADGRAAGRAEVATTKKATFTELDRRGSSCPVLFAWDGSHYQFVTDVIGAAVVGHWVSPVARNVADPDEWVKVDGNLLKARNGNMSVRFAEPMEEVNYIDQLRMVAVDHPAGTEVFPNEGFLNEPPFPTEKTFVSSAPHAPVAAWDDSGRNVLDLLGTQDHRYVFDFKLLNYAGYANMHTLTLDLGESDSCESSASVPERIHRVLLGLFHVCGVASWPRTDSAVC